MTLVAFLLVLVSVFLHAGWNFLSKKQIPSLSFYSLTSTTAALLWLPCFLLSDLRLGNLPAMFWPILAGSLVSEFIYIYGLANAYRKDDICLVYPLTRALPVLLTAAVTLLARHTDAALDPALLASARFKVECMPQLVVRSSTAPLA